MAFSQTAWLCYKGEKKQPLKDADVQEIQTVKQPLMQN